MPMEINAILLAIAVSADGFGVGLACGVRKLLILPLSILVISCASAGAVALSMFMGQGLAIFIPVEIVSQSGGLILLLLGLYFIIQNIGSNIKRKNNEDSRSRSNWINVDPEEADIDNSGTLNVRESLLLGVALGADAFGAGFGAVLVGLNPFITVFAVGVVKMLLIPTGVHLGRRAVSLGGVSRYAPVISGLVLMLIGFSVFL